MADFPDNPLLPFQSAPPSEGAPGFDYSTLEPDMAEKAHAAAVRIKGRFRTTISQIVEIGRDLKAIQKRMPHGAWGPWIDAEFGFSGHTALHYMNLAKFMEGKSETVSDLPQACLYALASPTADAVVVKQVVDAVEAGEPPPTTAAVKEKLAEARAAERKREAAQKKSPEQIEKEQKTTERRKIKDQKEDEKQAAIEASLVKAAEEIARQLVARFGAGGTLELFTLMGGIPFYRLEELFRPWVGGLSRRTLTEQEIEAKFGGYK
jgi:hypothetical protein